MPAAPTTSAARKTAPAIQLHPLEDRVVIRAFDEPAPRYGRLHIPDSAKEKPTQGEVLAVGPGKLEQGARVPLDVGVGEIVLYGKYSATPFQVGHDELLIVRASDILARIG